MISNQNLSKNLRDLAESIEDIVEKITDDEDKLKELGYCFINKKMEAL